MLSLSAPLANWGPDLLFPTGDNDGSTLVHLRYGLGVGVETGRLGASIEFWVFG